MNTHRLSRRWLPIAAAIAASAQGLTAYAAPAAGGAAPEIETMVVTGSRIARSETEASTPVQILNADFLEQQGSPNISDILSELPSVGTAGFSRANSNFATTGNGASTINLRNLDDKRTLVLLNGRRTVAGIGGSSSVDINNIPTDLIERVEVLTGGASAVYGSEAIAGVVNFILKDDFEGFRARAQWGRTSEEDNIRSLAAFTTGFNFMEERGNVTLNMQIDRDAGLRSKNRKISKEDNPFRSSFVPQGRFDVPIAEPGEDGPFDSIWTYGPDGVLKNSFNGPVDGFNRNGERYIAVPVDRNMLTLLSHYDFTDNFSVYFEGTRVQVRTNARLEPSATDNADAELPDGTILEGLDINNPFIPAAIRADMIAQGADTLPFRKRLAGVFDRSNDTRRSFGRYVLGAKGTAFEDINWDAYAQFGRSVDNTKSETALRDRYYYALDAIANPAGGNPICRDAAARANGCVPFNPFGFNSHSAASAAYIRNNQFDTYKAELEQTVYGVNFNGPLFDLPAGAVSFAAGVEFRKEESNETYSAETRSGNTLSNTLNDTNGDYDVKEGYLEVIVPILSDIPFIQNFEAEGAARVGDYSTVGSVFSWKAGATWTIDENVKLRGVFSKATRAPNIEELFEGASQTFPSGIDDPCSGVTATSNRTGGNFNDAYCRSLPGVAATIARVGVFEPNDNTDVQSYEGEDSGNPNLSEEVAKTWTLGLVLTPEFLPGFSMSVDWFKIKIDEAITLVPRQTSINECVKTGGTSSLCALVVREGATTPRPRTPGALYQIDSSPVNAALINTAGYDVAARYHFDMDESSLDFSLAYTYLSNLDQKTSATVPTEDDKGQLNGDGRLGAGYPHRANASISYNYGPFTATWRSNYLSRIRDTRIDADPVDDPLGEENRVSSYVYHDLQMRYEFEGDSKYAFYFGIDNVGNKKPPLIDQNRASNITGTETAAESYDTFGRNYYAGLDFSF